MDGRAQSKAAHSASNQADMSKRAGVMPSFVFKHFLHRDANIGKLVTREDEFHLHKTLGILALMSFLYRYAYVYPTQGNLGFSGNVLDWTTMVIHTTLALSSILFRVPRKRIGAKPMVIYEEYRQHAMVFTMRCFSVFALAVLAPQYAYLSPLVVMTHHLWADRVTAIWGSPGNTAVRATSARMGQVGWFFKAVAMSYSIYQFLAVGSHIYPNDRLADMAFNAIIAIQSSAFMMTLYRKRIIRARTHMAVYGTCLVTSAFHIVRVIGALPSLLVIATFFLRIKIPRAYSNKYAVWATSLFVYYLPSMVANGGVSMDALKGVAVAAVIYAVMRGERIFRGQSDHVRETSQSVKPQEAAVNKSKEGQRTPKRSASNRMIRSSN